MKKIQNLPVIQNCQAELVTNDNMSQGKQIMQIDGINVTMTPMITSLPYNGGLDSIRRDMTKVVSEMRETSPEELANVGTIHLQQVYCLVPVDVSVSHVDLK